MSRYYHNGGYIGASRRIYNPIVFVGGDVILFAGGTTNNTLTWNGTGSGTDVKLRGGIATLPRSGDFVIAALTIASTANTDMSGKLTGSGFTNLTELYSDDTYDTNLLVAYKFVGSTVDTSTVITGGSGSTSDAMTLALYVLRYVDPVTPFDVTETTATGINGRRADPPAITPVTPGAFIIGIGGNASGSATELGGSGFTTVNDTAQSDVLNGFATSYVTDTNAAATGIGLYRNWTSGSYNPNEFISLTSGTNDSWAAVTLALRPKYPGGFNGSTGMWSLQSKYQQASGYV